jgi:hypothetical protein
VTQLDFRPAAAADVEAAFRWYQVQREGLGDEFLNELVLVVHAIGENAYRFPVVHRDTRRALLHRFPYCAVLPHSSRQNNGCRLFPCGA